VVGVTIVTATSPVFSSGGTTPNISVSTAGSGLNFVLNNNPTIYALAVDEIRRSTLIVTLEPLVFRNGYGVMEPTVIPFNTVAINYGPEEFVIASTHYKVPDNNFQTGSIFIQNGPFNRVTGVLSGEEFVIAALETYPDWTDPTPPDFTGDINILSRQKISIFSQRATLINAEHLTLLCPAGDFKLSGNNVLLSCTLLMDIYSNAFYFHTPVAAIGGIDSQISGTIAWNAGNQFEALGVFSSKLYSVNFVKVTAGQFVNIFVEEQIGIAGSPVVPCLNGDITLRCNGRFFIPASPLIPSVQVGSINLYGSDTGGIGLYAKGGGVTIQSEQWTVLNNGITINAQNNAQLSLTGGPVTITANSSFSLQSPRYRFNLPTGNSNDLNGALFSISGGDWTNTFSGGTTALWSAAAIGSTRILSNNPVTYTVATTLFLDAPTAGDVKTTVIDFYTLYVNGNSFFSDNVKILGRVALTSNFEDVLILGDVGASTSPTGLTVKNAADQILKIGVAGVAGDYSSNSLQGDSVVAATKGLILNGAYWSLIAQETDTIRNATNFSGTGFVGTITVLNGTTTFPVGRLVTISDFSEAGLNGVHTVLGGSGTTITIATIYITSLTYGTVTISNYTPVGIRGNISHIGNLVVAGTALGGQVGITAPVLTASVGIVTPTIEVSSLTTSKLVISDIAGSLASVAGGTENQTLLIVGGLPTWTLLPLTTSVTGVLPVANGGTNLSAAGSNGQVLTTVAGTPAWTTPSTGTVTTVTASSPLASSGGATPNISITSSTGSGAVVLANTPTLITPSLGVATVQSLTMSLPSTFVIASSDTALTSYGMLLTAFRSSLILNGAGQPGGFLLAGSSSTSFCLITGAIELRGELNLSVDGGGTGNLTVPGTTTLSSTTTLSALTASSAVATNASKQLVSVTNTGTGSNVLANTPTLITPILGAATGTSLAVTGNLSTTDLLISSAFSNPTIDAVTGAVLIGYNTPKAVGAKDVVQIFNNSTDRTLLLKVTTAGTGSGSDAITITTPTHVGGNVGIRVFTASGTLSAAGASHTISLPSGVTSSNVISMSGVVQTTWLTAAFDHRDLAYYWTFTFNNVGSISVYTGALATSVAGNGYRLSFITSS
jgi:hypothetical protein